MRSIRLSLTFYFLVMLGAALGTVSVLLYRHAQTTHADKEVATRELVQARYREAEYRERERLDKDLLQQARTVAQRAVPRQDTPRIQKLHRDWERWSSHQTRSQHLAVQMLAAGLTPTPAAPSTLGFWLAEGKKHSFHFSAYWMLMSTARPQMRLQNDEPPPPLDEQVAEYCQIDSPLGTSFRSQSLRAQKLQFPCQPEWLDPNTPPYYLDWDDVRLSGDVQVRRVILVVPFSRLLRSVPAPPNNRGRDTRGRSAPSTSRPEYMSRPNLLIHYASDTSKRDAALAAIAAERDQELLTLSQEREESLLSLRHYLLLINGIAFAAMICGTFVLVRLGLSPLRRLSDAVSRVTERDFHLRLGDQRMPAELRPIVDRLTQTLEQLEHAFGREKQATADISHELRTPLAALMTTIEVTLRKPRGADEYRDALRDCQASAQQIHQAVERLLALARLDAGVDRLRAETIDAVDVARQCVSVVRPLAEARGLKLSLEAEEPAPLQTDPDKLREILNNLLHNAIQYNRPNGSIDVAVHRENGHLHLQVRDTGIGITTTARPHIFERFYRADPARQADAMHAGLGLAIVKGYLDLMGGSIEVNSVEGEGSTFSINLPA